VCVCYSSQLWLFALDCILLFFNALFCLLKDLNGPAFRPRYSLTVTKNLGSVFGGRMTFHIIPLAILLVIGSVNAQPGAAKKAFDYATEELDAVINTTAKYESTVSGAAVLRIQSCAPNFQKTNYDWIFSCKLTNVGNKSIAAVYIDVSTAIFPDVVYDADGTGGDDVANPLEHDWKSVETRPVDVTTYQWEWQPIRGEDYESDVPFDVNATDDVDNLFVDTLSDNKGAAGGHQGILILFQGFDNSETYEYSVDVDSNSIAGLSGGAILGGADWDVGGVSGAEMIGSTVSLLFEDGSTATGTLASDGSQAGAVAYIREESAMTAEQPEVIVNVDSKERDDDVVTYCANLTVSVKAAANETVRVTMIRAFNPVVSLFELANKTITAKALVEARLQTQFPYFPANNARELVHVMVTVENDAAVDITSSFPLAGVNDTLAFTAVVVDAECLPLSDVSEPVHLVYACTATTTAAPVMTPPVATNGTAAPATANATAPTAAPVAGNGTSLATKKPKAGDATPMPVVAPPPLAPAAELFPLAPTPVPDALGSSTNQSQQSSPPNYVWILALAVIALIVLATISGIYVWNKRRGTTHTAGEPPRDHRRMPSTHHQPEPGRGTASALADPPGNHVDSAVIGHRMDVAVIEGETEGNVENNGGDFPIAEVAKPRYKDQVRLDKTGSLPEVAAIAIDP
jgi:hypothetical protein